MYCIECGEKLPENAIFCPYCGALVEEDQMPETRAAEIEKNENADETDGTRTSQERAPQAVPERTARSGMEPSGARKPIGRKAQIGIAAGITAALIVVVIGAAPFLARAHQDISSPFGTGGGAAISSVESGSAGQAASSQELAKSEDSTSGSSASKQTAKVSSAGLKKYFKDMKRVNREFHDFSLDDFNQDFTKDASTRASLREGLDSLKSDVYSTLGSKHGKTWRIAKGEAPEGMRETRDDLIEASEPLIERWNCMDKALGAIDDLPESSSPKVRDKTGRKVLKEMKMSDLYKRYDHLESSIESDLG